MRVHPEGYFIVSASFAGLIIINLVLSWFSVVWWIQIPLLVLSLAGFGFVLQFFRDPRRQPIQDEGQVLSPADGKVVVIEKTEEHEYFKALRWQISIFMSPLDVHANRNPVSGRVLYYRYYPGRFLVAWHPKSSELNERNTIVLGSARGQVLFRQIAGAVARRIRCYLSPGEEVVQGAPMGFIKFGSRVDIFLPPDALIKVKMGQQVYAGLDVLAEFAPPAQD
ncbi:MAG: phosphatidylserine decarboxylase family protein [Microscillaceae bacterium]|nr:phosphatidylserine decarboxylase family protein [Microscillaceae bacterium]